MKPHEDTARDVLVVKLDECKMEILYSNCWWWANRPSAQFHQQTWGDCGQNGYCIQIFKMDIVFKYSKWILYSNIQNGYRISFCMLCIIWMKYSFP